jgi:putative toxin-antitoxin system antitoxin component (TIGR02293 family)
MNAKDHEIEIDRRKAEILDKATPVFGTRLKAEEWLSKPALGLDGHRPADLLASQAEMDRVEQLLMRIDYGVYT